MFSSLIYELLNTLKKIIEVRDLLQDTYIVGGTLRDIFIGRPIRDIDIAIKGEPISTARDFAKAIGGSFVLLHDQFPTARVVKNICRADTKGFRIEDGYTVQGRLEDETIVFDLASFRGKDIREDLLSRDFTINAMALPFASSILGASIEDAIDIVGARNDINGRCIRMVSIRNLAEDPLRLLRAYRFSAAFGFAITPETSDAITCLKDGIAGVAPERIWYELKELMGTAASFGAIRSMADTGLLFVILPQLEALTSTQHSHPLWVSPYHHLNVFDHTMLAYERAEDIINMPERFFPFSYPACNAAKKALLKFSVLLHDIGKPATMAVDRDLRIHFHGHEKVGAQIVEDICQGLRTSTMECSTISAIVKNHLRIPLLVRDHVLTKRAMVRLLKTVGEHVYGLLVAGLADLMAKKDTQRLEDFVAVCTRIVAFLEHEFLPRSQAPRFINGNDLIDLFGLTPSPLFKEILDMVQEKVLEGVVDSRDKALLEVKHFLESQEITY